MSQMYIRFGVHKDRDVLKEMRDGFSGIVLPAHILSHSADATRAAVDYIDKAYFIDPMTYIFTSENIKSYLTENKEDSSIKFKMSIEKLTTDYKLIDFFKDNNYRSIVPKDFTQQFLNDFALNNYNFQREKLNNQADSAFKKYAEILAQVTAEEYSFIDHKPSTIVPPYFYIEDIDDEWHKINLELARRTLEMKQADETVSPIILTTSKNLNSALLDSYGEFSKLILWITDLDESKASNDERQVKKLQKLKNFTLLAQAKNIDVMNLYGSYFSAVLEKYGMSSFCNGIFYGEYKNFRTKVGGGAPPARFYISAIHRFYIIPVAVAIMQDNEEIFQHEPAISRSMLNGQFENMFEMIKDQSLAQKHFLYARRQELDYVAGADIDTIKRSLKDSYEKYGHFDESISKDTPLQLLAWHDALESE